jgi:ParB-like chromosome segregation protein Spo0J
MSLFESAIATQADSICAMIDSLPLDDRVAMLNMVRARLHEISPFNSEPVDFVQWVPSETVRANDYNPNKVAPPEMRLLERSITEDGYTQPIVGCPVDGGIEVIDGFHRNKVGKTSKRVKERIHGYLPIVSIRADRTDSKDRMAATIRHNRARGVHGVMPMADIVADLIRSGWHDDEISKELGMDADEVLRFKQNIGLPELFKDHSFSPSWE